MRIRDWRTRGFTLLELMVTAAGLALLLAAVVRMATPIQVYFWHSHARQKATRETRICMETISSLLGRGRASSLTISTPSTTPTVQNSCANFIGDDGFQYQITWANTPLNTIHLMRGQSGGALTTDTVLATHVTALYFIADTRDPAMVNVSLRMTVPLDSSNLPGSFETYFLQNRVVKMNLS